MTDYKKILLQHLFSLCDVSDADKCAIEDAYNKSNPDSNFEEGYAERYHKMTENNPFLGLIEILKVFYNNTFRFYESTYCEGYGKLVDFLYSIDGASSEIEELVESLDEITNIDAFRDDEGYYVSDDNEVRRLRNVRDAYSLYEAAFDGDDDDFIRDEKVYEYKFYDTPEALAYINKSAASDKNEIAAEWLALHCVVEKEVVSVARNCTLKDAQGAMKRHFLSAIEGYLTPDTFKKASETLNGGRFIATDEFGASDRQAYSEFGVYGGSWKISESKLA